jgi:hypothetical protein
MEQKSPNKLWRESGTSLRFADWIEREKSKGNFMVNKKFEDFFNANGIESPQDWVSNNIEKSKEWVNDSIEKAKYNLGIEKIKQPIKKDNTFIGLNKGVLVVSGLIILGTIAYKIYQKRK